MVYNLTVSTASSIVNALTYNAVLSYCNVLHSQCCHRLVAPKKYKKSRKKVQIVPQKSTKKIRLQDLTHSNFLFKSH